MAVSKSSSAKANANTSGIPPEKKKAVEMAMQKIEKDYGKGSIMRLGDASSMQVERVSSGALTLDLALGGGITPWASNRSLWTREFR